MTTEPTVYLTNAATVSAVQRARSAGRTPSQESAACVGPGRVWTIMTAPRPAYGEAGQGAIQCFRPALQDLHDVKAGRITLDQYRSRTTARFGFDVRPGRLAAATAGGDVFVDDGDTLICSCKREEAAAGRCHRVWVAYRLRRYGWRVVLDGVELTREVADAHDVELVAEPRIEDSPVGPAIAGAICALWEAALLSEGQAAKLLGVDRVVARGMLGLFLADLEQRQKTRPELAQLDTAIREAMNPRDFMPPTPGEVVPE